MDDLDHSMHIAEYDWMSFYEESEECVLLQPSLASPDSSNLSDSEDSGNSSSVCATGQKCPEQNSANSDPGESSAAGCCMEEENCTGCVKYTSWQMQSGSGGGGGGQDDLTTQAEMCLDHPERTAIDAAELVTEESNDKITTLPQTEQLDVQSSEGGLSERKTEDGNVQMESDICECKSTQKCCLLSCNQTEVNVNEPHSTDGASSEDVSGVALRAEKERWFVTVNDSPARLQLRATSVKKKQRQKKPCKDNHTCRPGQERSLENGLQLEIMKEDDNDSEGGAVTEDVTQANRNLVKESGGYARTEGDAENVQKRVMSDSSQISLMSGEEANSLEKLAISHLPNGNINESTIDTFPPEGPSQLDSEESDELEDGVEFFSAHSFDSESYLSAAESVEELQHLLAERQQWQSSLSLTENNALLNVTENSDADREVHSCDSTHSCNLTATNSEGHKSADVLPNLTFPFAGQSLNKMLDENSACDNDTHSALPSGTCGFQKHEINLSASGCSSGDHPLPIPDLTVTRCSVADSPETYNEAAGSARPVYAISAFWDEMERLTINDILQLRLGRSTPPRETQETVTPNLDNRSSLVDTVEYRSSDSGQVDAYDTADSDYFTLPDESKPGRSSCEFSTSDFEEEYRQSFGASPDPQSKKQSASESPTSAHEDEESTGSEEKEIPGPSEDFARERSEDEYSNALISSKLAWPRQIRKSKSVHNIQALDAEDLSSQVLLGNDESSLFLSSCPSLEENTVLEASVRLGALMPSPFLDEHFKISFPDVFQYFFREDKAKSDSWCCTVYEPEDISVVPVFDYTLCTFGEEMSLSSLHDSQRSEGKPIPIFSCSHPTVRELTFPNPDYVFLSSDCEEDGDISPIRVLSHSFVQGSDCGAAGLHGFHSWESLIRKIRFPDKGSIWPRRSGAWMFPTEKITIKSVDPPMTVLTERRVSATPSQFFRELAVQQRTRREGIFSALKQSDMCLVCIAFASWVLKSSDPEAADAWKAALLANVSALSAIQYLRHYVKKKSPS